MIGSQYVREDIERRAQERTRIVLPALKASTARLIDS